MPLGRGGDTAAGSSLGNSQRRVASDPCERDCDDDGLNLNQRLSLGIELLNYSLATSLIQSTTVNPVTVRGWSVLWSLSLRLGVTKYRLDVGTRLTVAVDRPTAADRRRCFSLEGGWEATEVVDLIAPSYVRC